MSIGAGSAISELRCIRIPTCRWSRTACWAAAIERCRPSVIGKMTPGKSTTVRTGTMISASGGKGGGGAVGRPALASDPPGNVVSATERLRFLQGDQQAAVGGGPADRAVAPARKAHAALEPALRKLQAMNDRGSQLA